jgi:hypothetical protein
MITASGKQFVDWSSSYRIFEKDRVDTEKLFDVALRDGLQYCRSAYLWRWEIEVNFREEKTLIGCGQSQVRTFKKMSNPFAAAVFYARK